MSEQRSTSKSAAEDLERKVTTFELMSMIAWFEGDERPSADRITRGHMARALRELQKRRDAEAVAPQSPVSEQRSTSKSAAEDLAHCLESGYGLRVELVDAERLVRIVMSHAAENPQLQAHIRAVADFMQELGPYLGLDDGLVTTGEFIEAAKRIREWCHEHQRPLDFVRALQIAEGVFDQYRKDQPRWWRKMDGTPILNDVAVRMAEAFRDDAQLLVKASADGDRHE